jgi:hypothetical protein
MLLDNKKNCKAASAITIPIPRPPNVAINRKTKILAKSHFINKYIEDASIYILSLYIIYMWNKWNNMISILFIF